MRRGEENYAEESVTDEESVKNLTLLFDNAVTVKIDGPYGNLGIDFKSYNHFLLIAGGIGSENSSLQ